jgi:hypothetical protein
VQGKIRRQNTGARSQEGSKSVGGKRLEVRGENVFASDLKRAFSSEHSSSEAVLKQQSDDAMNATNAY